jgi:hypothetical protein
MPYSCVLRDGTVYVPTTAKTDAGYYMDREPVAVLPASNTDGLRRAFHDVIARGNAIISTPTRASQPPPILLKYAGVKTWSSFMHGASTWSIKDKDGKYQIVGYRAHPDGYWVEDPTQKVDFAPDSTIDEVIDRMIAILQATARK